MKKIISILLACLILFAGLLPAVFAERQSENTYPTIIVAGYSSSNLYLDGKQVWHIDGNDIVSAVLKNIARIGIGLGELAFRQPKYLSDVIGREIIRLTQYIAMNPDGTSVYPLSTWPADAEHTQFSYLYENYNGDNVHEAEIMADIGTLYGDDGNRFLFSYQQDFRYGMIDCAAALDKYVDSVREFTGKDKVNIYAVSHGGQTVAAYLALYGEKNAVNNVVMTVPAIGGAALAYDVLSEKIDFNEEELVVFVENGQMLETDFNWLVKANRLGILDDLFKSLVHNYVKKIVGYWGSMWDFVPMEYYDDLKNSLLDPVQSAAIIEKSDIWHYQILPTMGEKLRACIDRGANIYIVAGSESPSVTGLREQSDAIIPVAAATGALTAPYGFRFNDGYKTCGTVCDDPTHNHLSPGMTIDASAGWLPEQTWFIAGYFHGMTWKDEYLIGLCKTLIFADDLISVHTFKEYPQFKDSTAVNYSVHAAFDRSAEGYLSGQDSALTVTNLSKKYKMRIASVAVDGADIQINVTKVVYLDPGQSYAFTITGTLPEYSLSTVDVTVNYSLVGSVTPIGARTQTFTVMNGPAPVYDADSPYTAAWHSTVFDDQVSDAGKTLLQKTGLLAFIKMIMNRFMAILRALRIR